MGDDARSRFAARHPAVSSAACGCDGVRGRKCGSCRDALLRERAVLGERDAVVAFLRSLAEKRFALRSPSLIGDAHALQDAAALVEEGAHRAGPE